jgi:hypothetical protein
MNRADLLHRVEGPDDARLISSLFDYDSVVDWNGQRNEGPWSAAGFWASKVGEGEGRTLLFYETIVGESADRVRLIGLLSRPGAASSYDTARVEQIWRRDGEDFVAELISVGAFEPSTSD